MLMFFINSWTEIPPESSVTLAIRFALPHRHANLGIDKVSFVRVLIRTFCNLGFDVSIDFFFVQQGLIVLLKCFGIDPFLFPLSSKHDGFACTISGQLDRRRDEFFNFNRGFEIHVIVSQRPCRCFFQKNQEYYIFPKSI